MTAGVDGPPHHARVDLVALLIYTKHAPREIQHRQFLLGVLIREFHNLFDALNESDVGEDRASSAELSNKRRPKRTDCTINELTLNIGSAVGDDSEIEVGEKSGNDRQGRQNSDTPPNRPPLLDCHRHVEYFGGGHERWRSREPTEVERRPTTRLGSHRKPPSGDTGAVPLAGGDR